MTTVRSVQDGAVVREYEEPRSGLAAALAAFQAEMPKVRKGRRAEVPTNAGGSYSYTYADLASVSAAALPLLSKHGLAFTTLPQQTPTGLVLVGRLLHTSGESIEGALPLVGGRPQELGSSITYMRRYLLGCLTGIVTEDDDDGGKAQKAGRTRRERPTAPPEDEWTGPNPAAMTHEQIVGAVVERARAELATWMQAEGLDLQEAVDRWGREHDGEHIAHTTDAAGIRRMRDAWAEEIRLQRSAS
jgi:hypothetical protein